MFFISLTDFELSRIDCYNNIVDNYGKNIHNYGSAFGMD